MMRSVHLSPMSSRQQESGHSERCECVLHVLVFFGLMVALKLISTVSYVINAFVERSCLARLIIQLYGSDVCVFSGAELFVDFFAVFANSHLKMS